MAPAGVRVEGVADGDGNIGGELAVHVLRNGGKAEELKNSAR